MARIAYSITDTIKDIPKAEWERLFGEDLIEGYGYQKTLEDAGLKEFSFGYLLGKENNRLCLILPFFIMDFSFATLLPGLLGRMILSIQRLIPRFLKVKIVFLGSPTAEEFYLGMNKDASLSETLGGALERLKKFCKKEKIPLVSFSNICHKNSPLREYLGKKNFFKMETLPTTIIKIEAKNLDEYIEGLSHNTRKDLKRKLRKSRELVQLKTVLREDTDGIIGDIYRLYRNNFSDADISFENLTPEFFANICRNMKGIARYFITYDKDKIVAFNLFLAKGDLFPDKFIGFDKEVSHKYHLYYTTFCHNIDWCLKNGYRFYQPGVTDYHPKVRLGAKLIPLYIYSKAMNPLLNLCLKPVAYFIQPKNMDPVLKQLEETKDNLFIRE